jgi:hypothetical protein
MGTYLEHATPILAVKSAVYFEFQSRRMKELRNVQIHFSKYRPANYGTITSILMHMLRHIPHSPEPKVEYLTDALRDIHFYKVMDSFGTFFLHDLDLEKATVFGIEEKDGDKCLLAMSRAKSLRRVKEIRDMEVAVANNEEPTAQFPIGNAPTWEEMTSAMERNPTLLMSNWAWNERWSTASTAGRLFVLFTTDYFLTLSADVLKAHEFPKPRDLKAAMELWTVQSLTEVLMDVSFKATNHGLQGRVSGRRNPSFKEMVELFFPMPEFKIGKNSVWYPFFLKGYINEYHKTLHSMTEEESSSLLVGLKRIFGRIQCLPSAVSCTPKACGRLWEQYHGGVKMLTNPIFYKIERVGKVKRSATMRGKQVKASRAIIEARLDEHHRQIPFIEGRLKARQVKKARKRETKRRSGKKNNYRKPPIRRKKQASSTPISDESLREVHESSDESAPRVPSVRVLRRRVISEDDPEEEECDNDEEKIDELVHQSTDDEEECDNDEEEEIDELVHQSTDDEDEDDDDFIEGDDMDVDDDDMDDVDDDMDVD